MSMMTQPTKRRKLGLTWTGPEDEAEEDDDESGAYAAALALAGLGGTSIPSNDVQVYHVRDKSSPDRAVPVYKPVPKPSLADKPVVVFDKDSDVALRYYTSVWEAAEQLGVVHQYILGVCTQRAKTYKGLAWRFAHPQEQELGRVWEQVHEDELRRRMLHHSTPAKETKPSLDDKAIVVLDKESSEALRYYASVREAAVRLGIVNQYILAVCQERTKSYKGFGWRFAVPEDLEHALDAVEVSEEELKLMIHLHVPIQMTDDPVMVLDKDSGEVLRFYPSVREAAARMGIDSRGILNVCQQRLQSYKGLGWRFAVPEEVEGALEEDAAMTDEELKQRTKRSVPPKITAKAVVVLDYGTGVALKYFKSMTDAAARLGVAESGIMNVSKQRQKSSKGFGWRLARPEEIEQGCVDEEVSDKELRRRIQEHAPARGVIPAFNHKPCVVLDRDSGAILRYYESVTEAAARLGVAEGGVLNVCRPNRPSTSYKGLGWRLATPEEVELVEQQQRGVDEGLSDDELKLRVQQHTQTYQRKYNNNTMPLLGSNADRACVVQDKDTGVALRYYDSVREAGAQVGVTNQAIMNVCQKKVKSCKGFGWRFARPGEKENGRVKNQLSEDDIKRRTAPKLTDRPVMVLDKTTGEPLRCYSSVTLASELLQISGSGILSTCQGRINSHRGYGWRFATQEEREMGGEKKQQLQQQQDEEQEEEQDREMCVTKRYQSRNVSIADRSAPLVVTHKGTGAPIRYYGSLKEAAKRLGVESSRLLGVCQGRHKAYKGFGWRFAHPEEAEQGCRGVYDAMSEEELKTKLHEKEWLRMAVSLIGSAGAEDGVGGGVSGGEGGVGGGARDGAQAQEYLNSCSCA